VSNLAVVDRFIELYRELLAHDGFGEIWIEVRILKRRQKEIIIHCGKQYRYVVDFEPGREPDDLDKISTCLEKHLASNRKDAGSNGLKLISGGGEPKGTKGR